MSTGSPTGRLKPLLLHAHSTGPNPYKVAIALEYLSLPYEVKLWDFSDGPDGVKGTTFLKINPNGRVPALEDPNTDVISWESGAIINYLLREYDATANRLGPSRTEKQATVDFDTWVSFLLSTLGPMCGQLNWFRHYNEVHNQDAIDRYETQTYRTYAVLEQQLQRTGGTSILPGGYSAVDIHFYPWIRQYGFAGLSLDRFPLIQKWFHLVGERKEVKAAYQAIEAAAKN